MKSLKKCNSIFLFILVLILFANCGNWWNMMSSSGDSTIVIEGKKEIKNTRLVLSPGTTVIFKGYTHGTLGGTSYHPGELIIGDGATLIAKGTPENPIVFKLDEDTKSGYLTFKENCNTDSIIQYCIFENNIILDCYNNIIISKCKFEFSTVNIYKGKIIIDHNTFNGYNSTIIGKWELDPLVDLTITYNNINNSEREGVVFGNISPVIEYNNILSCISYAIFTGFSNNVLLVKNNYIKDCNGITGIDIDASQCLNVIYSNYYRTTPVPEAGCGW